MKVVGGPVGLGGRTKAFDGVRFISFPFPRVMKGQPTDSFGWFSFGPSWKGYYVQVGGQRRIFSMILPCSSSSGPWSEPRVVIGQAGKDPRMH